MRSIGFVGVFVFLHFALFVHTVHCVAFCRRFCSTPLAAPSDRQNRIAATPATTRFCVSSLVVRARPLAAGAPGCALVVLTNCSRRMCGAAFAPGMQLTEAGLGPAGVVSLADPVELPYGNDTETRHALHVTDLLSRSPSTTVPRSTQCPPGRGLLTL
jgi:hypothetical protein